MDQNNQNNDNQKKTDEDLLEEQEEFGPEDFAETEVAGEDEEAGEAEEEATDAASETVAAGQPAELKQSKLPWFLFAASVVAIGAILFIGKPGLGGAVAKVNGEKITKEQLYQEMYKQGGASTLDKMISDKLIDAEAKKKNLQVTDQDVENELKDIKSQFPDEEKFNEVLTQNKLTLDVLKENIRTQLKVSKVYESNMDLSDEKLKEFFEKNKASYGSPEKLEISHILVDKKEDADKLLADIKGGADFAQLAKEKSNDTASKDNGGSIGYYSRGQGLDPAFEEAAFKLNKGEVSGVVKSSFGFHIIKVTNKQAEVVPSFEDTKAKVRKDMVQQELQAKGTEWLEELKKNAKIEKLED